MASDKEKELMSQNEYLKDRLKEMETLFASQDEESDQTIRRLTAEKQALSQKVNGMERKLLDLNEEKAELIQENETLRSLKAPVPAAPAKIHTTFTLSDSMAQNFDDLQEKVDALETEKAELQSHLDEYRQQVHNYIQLIEDRDKICEDQQQTIQSMNKECNRLNKENNELRDSVSILQSQVDMLSMNTGEACDRGNSMFSELNEARLKAEAELKKFVERNISLEAEIEELNIRVRRSQHNGLTHADQGEIDFQKNHSEDMFSQLQEVTKAREKYANEIQELTKKLAATHVSENAHENLAFITLQRQLQTRDKEIKKLRANCDDQILKIHELYVKTTEIPALRNSIRRLENKQVVLEEEMKRSKGTVPLLLVAPEPVQPAENDENELPKKPQLLVTPSCPRKSRVDPNQTQPEVTKRNKWIKNLKSTYKENARNTNRERSLDAFRRGSRALSVTKTDNLDEL